MARLVLSPVPSNWLLLLLLLLLLPGEMVPAAQTKDPNAKPKDYVCSKTRQYPRFMAKKRGSVARIMCQLNNQSTVVTWLWKQHEDSELKTLPPEEGRILQSQSPFSANLTIKGIQFQDNGIYFCQQQHPNGSLEKGCGTELRVLGFSTLEQLKQRNTLKDGIIMIQTLLIILFIIVPIFLLLDKDESKAGMEEDHTYEGLNIDQTATYEDIVTLRTGEVKWSVGERPGQE